MKSISAQLFARLYCLFAFGSTIVLGDSVSDADAIRIADTALLDIPYGLEEPIGVVRTNGVVVVTFPADLDGIQTNMPLHAAVVWIDESSSEILPNPGLVPLSDSEAIQIATNQVPIPFDHSKTVRVDRASSLTRVTLPAPDLEIVPGVFYTNGFASRIWIDTQMKMVLDVEIPAD